MSAWQVTIVRSVGGQLKATTFSVEGARPDKKDVAREHGCSPSNVTIRRAK